jgi:hypothetical protein
MAQQDEWYVHALPTPVPRDYERIRANVALRKNEPALFGWYLVDEPEGGGITPEMMRAACDIVKQIDPDHPVIIGTNVPGMLKHYEGCADAIGADPYPIPNHPLTMVADWTDAAVSATAGRRQCPWMILQAFGWADIGEGHAAQDSPTQEQFTNMLYTALIHGAKAVMWWPFTTARGSYWPHFERLGQQVRFLEPFLLHGTDAEGMPAGVQSAGHVHWRAWQHEGRTVILAANLTYRPQTLTIPLPEGVSTVTLPFERLVIGPSPPKHPWQYKPYTKNGKLHLSFAAAQSALIVIGDEAPHDDWQRQP